LDKQNYSMVIGHGGLLNFEGEVCLLKQFMIINAFTINCLQNYRTIDKIFIRSTMKNSKLSPTIDVF